MSRIAIIINANSGSGIRHKILYVALEGMKDTVTLYELTREEKVIDTVQRAWNEGSKVIVAAGGDGTVSCVASAIIELGIEVKLGVLPIGTLNHFAKDIGMPQDIESAFKAFHAGKSMFVDAAKVNDRYFINNSSLGLYPFVVSERDAIKRRGFRKWIRFVVATMKALKKYPFVRVAFETSEKRFVRKTPFVFIGNNTYDIEAGKMGTRSSLTDGKLSLYIAHKGSRFRLIMLAFHAFRGTVKAQKDFDTIGISTLEIQSKKSTLNVACDGEVIPMVPPIRYSIAPKALNVIIP